MPARATSVTLTPIRSSRTTPPSVTTYPHTTSRINACFSVIGSNLPTARRQKDESDHDPETEQDAHTNGAAPLPVRGRSEGSQRLTKEGADRDRRSDSTGDRGQFVDRHASDGQHP